MWKETEPVFRDYLQANDAAQLLAFRQLEVLRVPSLHEELTCTTSVFDCRGAKGFRNTIISDASGTPCYVSWTQGAFVNMKTGRLIRIPQEVIDTMQMHPRYEMNYRERKIALPDIAGISLPQIAVQRNDIDYNQHVNNAQYVRMALEFLPAGFEIAGMRVEYKQPAKLGSRLTPTLRESKGSLYVSLCDAGAPVCTMEFTPASQSTGWFAW